MPAATLDLPVLADGQLDGDQSPLQQFAAAVAALWSAGTGLALQPTAVALEDAHARVVLAEPWPAALDEAPEAALSRLDRPFGRHACDLAPLLAAPARQLLGRPLTRVRAHGHPDQGALSSSSGWHQPEGPAASPEELSARDRDSRTTAAICSGGTQRVWSR